MSGNNASELVINSPISSSNRDGFILPLHEANRVDLPKKFSKPPLTVTADFGEYNNDGDADDDAEDDDDDDDEDFYEETLKKTYDKQYRGAGSDLNNTRSSTLTSSSSCSSAFSSMSNLNSTASNHDVSRHLNASANAASVSLNVASPSSAEPVAIDLSKYINNDESSSDENEAHGHRFNEVNNESFDEFFTANSRNNK